MTEQEIDISRSTSPASTTNMVELTLDRQLNFHLSIDTWVSSGLLLFLIMALLSRFFRMPQRFWKTFEINEAEFGLGDQKIKLTPNLVDQQIAYKIWVELSTRKIGIPIDTENDVIAEIYDSWFNFFSVTRELIKDVPVQKFRRKDTEQIVRLSIEVLNLGIRPHLTLWQARFRRWYENQLKQEGNVDIHPQDIQKKFPQFSELEKDMLEVNQRLINYREKMYDIITLS